MSLSCFMSAYEQSMSLLHEGNNMVHGYQCALYSRATHYHSQTLSLSTMTYVKVKCLRGS